ncbi:MAG: hypothetical protein NWQ55_05115, partial [Salibacteraceae bacterium]|nr:hypothetical protein [Salibacteraceae bacterium]
SEYKTLPTGERIKRDVRITKEMSTYILLGTAVTLGLFFRLVFLVKQLPSPSLSALMENQEIVMYTLFVLISVFAQGQMLENTKNAFIAEIVRLVGFAFLAFYFFAQLEIASWLIPAALAYSIASLAWLIRLTFFAGEQITLVVKEA